MNTLFKLGKLVMTQGAINKISIDDMQIGLMKHSMGDWGDMPEEDKIQNNKSLEWGDRLMSAYKSGETKFWIITEADRSVTTILLPEEY